jgi:hypothetical protein
LLRPGEAITVAQVDAFVRQLTEAPFRTVAEALLGSAGATPCPCCRVADSRLGVLDHNGRCYRCGRVSLELLFAAAYRADNHESKESVATPNPETGRVATAGRRNTPRGGKPGKRRPGPSRSS